MSADKRAKIAALNHLENAREIIDGWADDKLSEYTNYSSDLEDEEDEEDEEGIRLSDESDQLSKARDKVEELLSFVGDLPPIFPST